MFTMALRLHWHCQRNHGVRFQLILGLVEILDVAIVQHWVNIKWHWLVASPQQGSFGRLSEWLRSCSGRNLCDTRNVVWDSSAVRWVFVRLAGAVEHQSALHKKNSGFAAPTPGRHISTFRDYKILFSIRNPYINRFTNYFSIHSKPSYPQKVVLQLLPRENWRKLFN